MSKNVRISVALVAAFAAVVAIVLVVTRGDNDPETAATGSGAAGNSALVRDNSHRLDEATDGATLVEFLDFECESCGAAYPLVEQIRERFQGRLTYVIRYFPLPSHLNAQNAAVAVEAAAQQGRLEDMYSMMFTTQAQWGDQQQDKSALFRQYAVDLGLDMAAFDAAVVAPATLDRVMADRNDGLSLGVEATPTFFLNGEKLTPQSGADFISSIEKALQE